MIDEHDQLLRWLNDAYMMERSVEQMLLKHLGDFRDMEPWRARLASHLGETREHARCVERCIHRLGGKTSKVKTVVGEVVGRLQGFSTAMYPDERIKNAIAAYACEHFEIACYESLVAAADQLGEQEVVRVCREIRSEEDAMAQWIREHMPEITMHYLHTTAA